MEKISLNGVFSEEYLMERIMNLYENGLPEGYKIGLKSVDDIFRLDKGMLAVWTGMPGSGKSEFLDFACVRINRKYNIKTVYFSPENSPVELHLQKLISKLTNKGYSQHTKEDVKANMKYIFQNFKFINFNAVTTLDDILKQAEYYVLNCGFKIVNIDPYNKIEHHRSHNKTETEYISEVMDKLQRFAKKYNVLVNLVAHPRIQQTTDMCNINMYSISGSANFANKADYIIVVHRNKHKDIEKETVTIKCDKCKFKNYGRTGETEVKYDYQSGNYFDADTTTFNTHEEDMYMTALKVLEQIDNKEKQKNVLDVSVSYFEHIYDKIGTVINLYDYLIDKEKYYYNRYSQVIKQIRQATFNGDKEHKQELKRNLLGGITISCLTGNDKSDVKSINNLICIDIDEADNKLIMDRVPALLKNISCVAYMSKSASGKGYYAIIPIAYTDKFKEHFNALEHDLKNIGIVIDKSCSNPNRFRYYSVPDEEYINTNAEVYTTLLEDKRETTTTDNRELKTVSINDKSIVDMLDYINTNKLDITNTYQRWLSVTAAIANTYQEQGRDLYHSICKQYKGYNTYECDDKYNDLLNNPLSEFGIGTLFYTFNERRKEYEAKNKQA